ncbi:MAG: hypothetical protein ACPGUV_14290, partial [Polyangiales bacterium]
LAHRRASEAVVDACTPGERLRPSETDGLQHAGCVDRAVDALSHQLQAPLQTTALLFHAEAQPDGFVAWRMAQ